MLAKQGKMVEARRWLADLPAVTIEQRVQVRQAEAQLLRDANDNAGAYAVLLLALKEHPDSTDGRGKGVRKGFRPGRMGRAPL